MTLENFKKIESIVEKIKKSERLDNNIKAIYQKNCNKNLSSEDIKWVIHTASDLNHLEMFRLKQELEDF